MGEVLNKYNTQVSMCLTTTQSKSDCVQVRESKREGAILGLLSHLTANQQQIYAVCVHVCVCVYNEGSWGET